MKGDFSRDTFDSRNHFLRVLMQQGRVQIDADWNEQAAILLHYMQTLAKDIIGPYGGPKGNCGFQIIASEADLRKDLADKGLMDNTKIDSIVKELAPALNEGKFLIGPGRYYVDGLICENDKYLSYIQQKDFHHDSVKNEDIFGNDSSPAFVYLDVWERHLAWHELPSSEVPGIREVALGGPDTATRSRIVWQVKFYQPANGKCADLIKTITDYLQPDNRGRLRAKARGTTSANKSQCIIPPKARYRGCENQLYRVEVHRSGTAKDATFKWSRENGSVVYPIRNGSIQIPVPNPMIVTLDNLGKDDRFSLDEGDWVEFVYEDYTLKNLAYPMLKVEELDLINMVATLKWEVDNPCVATTNFEQPYLRRWDQSDKGKSKVEAFGDIHITENDGDDWIELEDGIQIQFSKMPEEHKYRTGDYWLIPARTENGDVEWPKDGDDPQSVRPHGVEHHYAPLATLLLDNGTIKAIPCPGNCFENVAELTPLPPS